MVNLDSITKVFNLNTPKENLVLDNISSQIDDGDFITVIGSNGAGKSTMLNAIAGVFPLNKGKIILDGQTLQTLQNINGLLYWPSVSKILCLAHHPQ